MLNRYMAARAQELEDTRKAIEQGIDLCRAEGVTVRLPADMRNLVWRLLQDAAETLARLPDKERTWLLSCERAAWPTVIHTGQEHYEAELQRIVELKENPTQTKPPRLSITDPKAVSRMLVVLDWLRLLTARNPKRLKRDKLVVLALAQGQSCAQVSRRLMHDKTPTAAWQVKQKAVGQIAQALTASCKLNEFRQILSNSTHDGDLRVA